MKPRVPQTKHFPRATSFDASPASYLPPSMHIVAVDNQTTDVLTVDVRISGFATVPPDFAWIPHTDQPTSAGLSVLSPHFMTEPIEITTVSGSSATTETCVMTLTFDLEDEYGDPFGSNLNTVEIQARDDSAHDFAAAFYIAK
ncbi:MAG: hypothetical protein RLY93_19595 [Sumerlaeia bacterium]